MKKIDDKITLTYETDHWEIQCLCTSIMIYLEHKIEETRNKWGHTHLDIMDYQSLEKFIKITDKEICQLFESLWSYLEGAEDGNYYMRFWIDMWDKYFKPEKTVRKVKKKSKE